MNHAQTQLNGFDPKTYQPVGIVAPKERFRTKVEKDLAELAPEVRNNGVPQAPARPGRGKQFGWAAVALVSAVVLLKFGLGWWTTGRFIESTDDAYVGGDVTVIAPKVSGFIASVFVADNQSVKAGDLLVKLDDRDYAAALAKAEAAIAVQRAALENSEATRRLQESLIAQAEAVIAAADAEIVRTREDQIRGVELLRNAALSLQDSQRFDAAYKTALADGDKARAGLVAAQRQLQVIEAQKQQIRAALAGAEAERDLARLNVGYTELRAPIDGVIGNRSGRAGAYAAVGSQLISLVPAKGLWIDANFKESQLARVRPGCAAEMEVDSIPGRVLEGRVQSVAPATGAQFSLLPPENATGNFTKIVQRVAVRIVLDDEAAVGGELRPGLSVTARVNTHSTTTGHE
jgi:membrane fusion protein (multidrug efflux system)